MLLKTWQPPVRTHQVSRLTRSSRSVRDKKVRDVCCARKPGVNIRDGLCLSLSKHEDVRHGFSPNQFGKTHDGGLDDEIVHSKLKVARATNEPQCVTAAARSSLYNSAMRTEAFPFGQLSCHGRAHASRAFVSHALTNTLKWTRNLSSTRSLQSAQSSSEIVLNDEVLQIPETVLSMNNSASASSLSPSLLKFQIPPATIDRHSSSTPEDLRFYSHDLYHGPDGTAPVVHYCRTREDAERVAKLFSGQKLLGLDLEWRSRMPKGYKANFKESVSVLQLASEERIAIFHLALFSENTPLRLMPPTLRSILMATDVVKVGVNIKGDCTRLKTHYNILSNGILELSHLYRLIRPSESTAKVSKAPVKLALQVEEHLGYALDKSDVRTSDWSRELNDEQRHYAAADAYCAVHLYDIMNRKRLAMSPVPDLPAVVNYQEIETKSILDPFLRSEAVDSWLEKFLGQKEPGYRLRNLLSLRIYAAWKYEELDLEDLQKLQKSTSMTKLTMAYFLLEAIRLEKLPFDLERLKAVLELIPPAAAGRYKDLQLRSNDMHIEGPRVVEHAAVDTLG